MNGTELREIQRPGGEPSVEQSVRMIEYVDAVCTLPQQMSSQAPDLQRVSTMWRETRADLGARPGEFLPNGTWPPQTADPDLEPERREIGAKCLDYPLGPTEDQTVH
jgi:hypothetical protein